jgi:pimeloyl-ACP methyl ester carboxylesterase
MFRYAWKTGRPPGALVEGYADAYAAPERVRAMVGYYRAAVRRSSKQGGNRGTDGPAEPLARAERSLVVWGTDDPPMPLRVGESVVSDLGRVNDPASVQMVTLPGVGHWPLDEVPDVTVPLVADFLRRP